MKTYQTDTSAIDAMAEKWPSTVVSRQELYRFSGGILNGRTQANRESKRDGRALKPFRIGKKIFYRVQDVIDFLKSEISK